MGWLARRLRSRGFDAHAPTYRSRTRGMDALAASIAEYIDNAGRDAERVHVVAHSLGALVALRALALRKSPPSGAMILLGPPLNGSEVADIAARSRMFRLFLGRSGHLLGTDCRRKGWDIPEGIDVGVIAGNKPWLPLPARVLPRPNDGKVTIASMLSSPAFKHVVLPTGHARMLTDRRVLRQVLAFMRTGSFADADDRSSRLSIEGTGL